MINYFKVKYHKNDDIFNINTSLYKRMTQCPRIFISVKQLPYVFRF